MINFRSASKLFEPEHVAGLSRFLCWHLDRRLGTVEDARPVDAAETSGTFMIGYAELFPGFFVYTKAAALGLQAGWTSAIEERCPLA
jgi:hypothetical protein